MNDSKNSTPNDAQNSAQNAPRNDVQNITQKTLQNAAQEAVQEAVQNSTPLHHIAIIMDGNGRWAQKQGFQRAFGHRVGAETVEKIVAECVRLGIEYLTLYCFSNENWKRPKLELRAIMRLLEHFMVSSRPMMKKNNVRLKIIGRPDGIPASALRKMEESVSLSASNTGLVLTLAINYGGRQEIVDAARSIAEEAVKGTLNPENIDEKTVSNHLYTAGTPDPDLLIRTAGELRLSNYLLWQLSYAELWVTDVCWPDFTEELLHDAIEAYRQRVRRFGAVLKK